MSRHLLLLHSKQLHRVEPAQIGMAANGLFKELRHADVKQTTYWTEATRPHAFFQPAQQETFYHDPALIAAVRFVSEERHVRYRQVGIVVLVTIIEPMLHSKPYSRCYCLVLSEHLHNTALEMHSHTIAGK